MNPLDYLKINKGQKITSTDKYSILKHHSPSLRGLSDERIEELVTENSNGIREEQYKAESWDLLVKYTEETTLGGIEMDTLRNKMKAIYLEVKADDKL